MPALPNALKYAVSLLVVLFGALHKSIVTSFSCGEGGNFSLQPLKQLAVFLHHFCRRCAGGSCTTACGCWRGSLLLPVMRHKILYTTHCKVNLRSALIRTCLSRCSNALTLRSQVER